ncbi:MAG TPA: Tm-1-like ATP-binding domain-containing protein [Syntrophorhabdales bacterium]|nr:Tm-1-like ATP-binding domain-containing protein [Syntrophorhabdales bacterium]
MKRILLIGTLDTKGNEIFFMKELVQQMGFEPLVIDIGIVGEPVFVADITKEEVLKEIGKDLESVVSLNNEAQATRIMATALVPLVKKLFDEGRIDAVIAIGGGQGSQMCAPAMQQLPIGFPKILVSTKAVQAGIRTYVGSKDIVIIPPICDIAGLNRITRKVLANAVGAAVGMLRVPSLPEARGPLVVMSMMGLTTRCGIRVKDLLEKDGCEVVVFHCVGPGGIAMEEFIRQNKVECVIELALGEISNELFGGMASAGKDRLQAAGEKAVTQIIVPGSVDIINFVEKETIPEKYRHRRIYVHNPQANSIRMEKEDMVLIAKTIADKLNRARGRVEVVIPLKGFSEWDGEGKVFDEPDTTALFVSTLEEHIHPEIQVTKVAAHINDPAFATLLGDKFKGLTKAHV